MNEIKWEKFIKSCEKSENSQKLAKNITNLIEDLEKYPNSNDIDYKIYQILQEMSEDEEKEAIVLINEILNKL